jgi:hypothetical protein
MILFAEAGSLYGQDSTRLIQFSQVFWAEKAMKQDLQDSMEIVMAEYYQDNPNTIAAGDPVARAFVQARKGDYARLSADRLGVLCSRIGISQDDYDNIKDRYYADSRYQTEIYPILIRYAGNED